MQNPFENIKDILNDSCLEAERHYSQRVSIEHLLLSILKHDDATLHGIFDNFGINIQVLRATLNDSQRDKGDHTESFDSPAIIAYENNTSEVIRDSVVEAKICKGNFAHVEPEHLLLAILKESSCAPAQLLITQGLTYDKLMDYIKNNEQMNPAHDQEQREEDEEDDEDEEIQNFDDEDEETKVESDIMDAETDNKDFDFIDEESTGDIMEPEDNEPDAHHLPNPQQRMNAADKKNPIPHTKI